MSHPRRAPRKHLRNRLMLVFAGFTLVVAALFGVYAAAFGYAVEDRFFHSLLEHESSEQIVHHAGSGQWKTPRESWVRVIESPAALPDGIGAILAVQPRRTEFPGQQGRHYHLKGLPVPDGHAPAWLLAEVGPLLVVRSQRATLLHWLGWSGVVAVGLALMLGWWLARRTTAPLSRLAQLVDGIDPQHMPAAFAGNFPADEVGVLARGIEALTARIRAFVTREREFTRDASHELRTPLAVIRSTTERLAHDATLSPVARQGLSRIHLSALQLEQTVTMLLTLAREQALPDDGTPVPLLPLVERVVVERSAALDDRQLEVTVAVPADTTSDLPVAVLQVLLANLIGNAFAHAAHGHIEINVRHGCLCIANRGGHIAPQALQAFVKDEASTGFGLGLSIVQRLCEHHGITLAISNDAAGVTVRLPLSRDRAAA